MSTQYQSPQSSVPQPYASVPHRTNTLAIISLVAAFVAPLIGFILGLVAMSQARRRSEGAAASRSPRSSSVGWSRCCTSGCS
ncbi:hypothetical protein QP157_01025 [Sphingomonas sp. LR61]|uniref:hypothetical protein n=1 Tax=Sphingomonas sp. LR61 TaxID=3050234 RepID=UPI002FE1E9E7